MINPEFAKANTRNLCDVIAYQPGQIVSKTITLKPTGTITVYAFAEGEESTAVVSAFDNLIQVIDGTALVLMNDHRVELMTGQVLTIPAHTLHKFVSKVQFKMVMTVIKSGYEM